MWLDFEDTRNREEMTTFFREKLVGGENGDFFNTKDQNPSFISFYTNLFVAVVAYINNVAVDSTKTREEICEKLGQLDVYFFPYLHCWTELKNKYATIEFRKPSKCIAMETTSERVIADVVVTVAECGITESGENITVQEDLLQITDDLVVMASGDFEDEENEHHIVREHVHENGVSTSKEPEVTVNTMEIVRSVELVAESSKMVHQLIPKDSNFHESVYISENLYRARQVSNKVKFWRIFRVSPHRYKTTLENSSNSVKHWLKWRVSPHRLKCGQSL